MQLYPAPEDAYYKYILYLRIAIHYGMIFSAFRLFLENALNERFAKHSFCLHNIILLIFFVIEINEKHVEL